MHFERGLWDDLSMRINVQKVFGWRLATAAIWAGVAASGWYWTQAGLFAARPAAVEAIVAAAPVEISNPAELARLLGAPPRVAAGPGPGPAERFSLIGVIAKVAGQGAALIAVDGKPAQPFAVGAQIAPGYVLVSVGLRDAKVADDSQAPTSVVLSMPVLRDGSSPTASATTGLLAVAGSPITAPAMAAPAATSAAAPAASEEVIVTGPPARADSRRQSPGSLRREDRRTP